MSFRTCKACGLFIVTRIMKTQRANSDENNIIIIFHQNWFVGKWNSALFNILY